VPDGWTRTYTAGETIELLKTGRVTHLSLDHDLGVRPEGPEDTGYYVLRWLEQEVGHGRWQHPLPKRSVHSANPPAHERMLKAIASIERLHQQQEAS
jgi:hypothetical protein